MKKKSSIFVFLLYYFVVTLSEKLRRDEIANSVWHLTEKEKKKKVGEQGENREELILLRAIALVLFYCYKLS